MGIDLIIIFAVSCVVIGLGGFLWNIAAMFNSRSPVKAQPKSTLSKPVASEDRVLYERALALVRENRISDGARILEELGLAREASTVLERGGMVHEAAGVFFRRKRYHRAGEVYARHKMWEQAGHSYLLAAQGPAGVHSSNLHLAMGGTATDVKTVDKGHSGKSAG